MSEDGRIMILTGIQLARGQDGGWALRVSYTEPEDPGITRVFRGPFGELAEQLRLLDTIEQSMEASDGTPFPAP